MAALLAAQEPFWPPGSTLCYHPLTFGWLCAELIRRVDGRTAGAFFAEEVAAPLGLEIWIGLPERFEARVATLRREGPQGPEQPMGSREWMISGNPPLWDGEPTAWNSRAFHAAEIPGAGAIGSARSIARLYGCLACGGELDGVRLLTSETIELGTRCVARGRDECFGWPLAFGVGLALQTELLELGPPEAAFGHGGAGGSVHGAWPRQRVGFSYAMNDMRWEDSSRSDDLLRALYEAVSSAD
jgi:CubicO group peptidase (beta-lactamase class C family)